jgi:hypothetical protein
MVERVNNPNLSPLYYPTPASSDNLLPSRVMWGTCALVIDLEYSIVADHDEMILN